jgi:hypothetical protein
VREQQPRLDVGGALAAVDGDGDATYLDSVGGRLGYLVEQAGHAASSSVVEMRVRILVTKVCTTCFLYAALPRWSVRGRAASAASSAARAMVAASSRCPESESAASRASMVEPPTPVRRSRPGRCCLGVLDRDGHAGGGEVADRRSSLR